MSTTSAMQKYAPNATTVGTKPAQTAPARLVASPNNQTIRKAIDIASALWDL